MAALNVVALIACEPGPLDLWTLRAIASAGCMLTILQSSCAAQSPRWRRALSLARRQGLRRALSRGAGSLIAARIARQDRELLEELFDMDDLLEWRRSARPAVRLVSGLNSPDCHQALRELAPDIIVRVSGGVLGAEVLRTARLAALNIHHGVAPRIRGMWSIPWAIVEDRADWIGAAIHVMDEGIDTGPVLWRGSPQLAPGDTSVDLLFRAHLEAASALSGLLGAYARGETPVPLALPANETSTYRSAAGVGDWARFLWRAKGRHARVLLERGLR